MIMNYYKIIFLCSIICLTKVKCEPPSNQYGTPLNNYGQQNNYDHHNHDHHNHDYGEPKSYEFGYQVKDDYSGNNYKRQEVSDGNQVQGEYRVQLPDGRLQIVTYYADWQTGFHADVRYEGEASYPETYGNGNHGGYANSGVAAQNNYNHQQQHGYNNAPATSSVSIKDFSGTATPYNAGGGGGYNNNYNNGYQHGHNGYGNHGTPNNAYGAPYK